MKTFLAILAGFAGFMVITFALEMGSHLVYPPPAGMEEACQRQDMVAVKAMMDSMPTGASVLQIIIHFLSCFCGVAIANKVNSRSARLNTVVIAALYLAISIYMFTSLPHPPFMVYGTYAAVIIAAAFAGHLTRHKPQQSM